MATIIKQPNGLYSLEDFDMRLANRAITGVLCAYGYCDNRHDCEILSRAEDLFVETSRFKPIMECKEFNHSDNGEFSLDIDFKYEE